MLLIGVNRSPYVSRGDAGESSCRRRMRLAASAAVLALRVIVTVAVVGALAVGLAGCDLYQRRMTQNFRITVEDEFGLKLGSGVWRYEENVPQVHLSVYAGWDGEAFPIVHPTRGKMYVIKGGNSGWRQMGGGHQTALSTDRSHSC